MTNLPDGTVGELPDWLRRRAELQPTQLALLAGPVAWTFGELDQRATDAARCLATRGVGPGTRVALLAGNGPAFVVTVHAIGRLGATLVPLNTRLTAAEIAWQLADVGTGLLLHDRAQAEVACAAVAELPNVGRIELGPFGPEGPCDEAAVLRDRIALDAMHSIVYTSGTSGRPKGALLTWGNHWWSAVGSALHLGHHRDDRWLAPLPLFHVGGLAILLRSVIYGIPVILHDAFDAVQINRAIEAESVTIVSVVATMLRRMLEERGARPYPATLRCILLGGGPAPRSLLEECLRQGVPVALSYGLTETASQVATLLPEDALRKFGSSGKPLLPTELRIERDGGPARPGAVGEIVVRGPTVTPGYAGQPAETVRAWRGGWFHTGDLGYFDDDSYLYVLDRRDDLIVSGGENIYPAEVEAALLAHPGVEDAGVIGVPDEQWGQTPLAVVCRRAGATVTAEELLAFCAARLAGYKVPRAVRWVDTLPRNAAGKLLRRTLRTGVAAR